MTVLRVERVVYGVEDLDECARFFADLGLDRVDGSGTAIALRTRAGQQVELRPLDAPDLPAPVEPGSTLREIVWGVDTAQAWDEVVARISSDRPVAVTDGTAHTVDDTGFGVGVVIADRRALAVEAPSYNSWAGVTRWNSGRRIVERVRPLRICHVALNIPKQGREAAVGFYVERLGFRVTDNVRDMGVFLRAEGDHDQHTFLLCHRPDKASVNHIACEVEGFDEVIVGVNAMVEAGWREARKLGRHTVGSNVFRFVHAPCGGRVELAADMDRVDDSYGPNYYEQTPPHHLWQLQTSHGPGGSDD